MDRRKMAIGIGAILLVGLGTAGAVRLLINGSPAATLVAARPSTCDDTFRVLKLPPSQVAAAKAVCLNQTIQLSGELRGSVAQAYPVNPNAVAATAMCAEPKRWDSFPQAVLAFAIGTKAYRLRISPPGSSEHQPLSVNNLAGVVDLAAIGAAADWNQASGTLTLSSDGVTGSR